MENPYQPPATTGEIPLLPVAELKNPRVLGLLAVWLYGIGTGVQAVDHLWRTLAHLPPTAASGNLPLSFPVGVNDTYHVGMVGGPLEWLMLVAGLGSTVFYLMWKYRAAVNARILDPSVMKMAPGVAVASYYIPIVFFFGPYLAMAGISRATLGNAAGIGLWWAFHVGLAIFGLGSGIHAVATKASARPDLFTHVSMVGAVIACLISIWLVMRITRGQAARCG